jgi:nitroreductase
MSEMIAVTDYPIHELLARRWSPHLFQKTPVRESDLRSLFEAARWAPSSYNEQPWSYIVATKHKPEEFSRLLSCLAEGNQVWAKTAPVLALGVVTLKFQRNGKDNRAAIHDLGLAAGNLLVEAMSRGLSVHQMIGISPERARELFQIPQNSEAWTALAIGYKEATDAVPEDYMKRALASRHRKSQSQFVFNGKWGVSWIGAAGNP